MTNDNLKKTARKDEELEGSGTRWTPGILDKGI